MITEDGYEGLGRIIVEHRRALEKSIVAALYHTEQAQRTRNHLAADDLYDVEHAEGSDGPLIERLLTQARDALRAASCIAVHIHSLDE